jgi:hypothetical protein
LSDGSTSASDDWSKTTREPEHELWRQRNGRNDNRQLGK